MPGSSRFNTVRKMLESAGYELNRIRGSHHYFTKPGRTPISVPVHKGKVKPFYVRQVKQIVEEETG